MKNHSRPGVLPVQHLRDLAAARHIDAPTPIREQHYQPASLDLRLGAAARRLQASFLTGPAATVTDKLAKLEKARLDLRRPTIIERDCVYLVELHERLFPPETLRGKANPKSTTERLDVFTRVVTDHGDASTASPPATTDRSGSRSSHARSRSSSAKATA